MITKGQSEPDSLFQKGNRYFQEEQYEKAVEAYLAIYESGLQSSELFYNTANAYYRSNKLGKARLFYERALLLDPGDQDILTNLEYVKSMLTDRFEVIPEFFLRRWFRNIIHSVSSNGWLLISLIFFGGFILAASAYIYLPSVKMKKTGFYVGIFLFLFTILSFIFSNRQYHYSVHSGASVVMEGSLVVKSAPRNSGKDLFILHEGTKIWVDNQVENWLEVRISDGRKGWVESSSVENI